MRTRHLAPLIALPVVLLALAGCQASAPPPVVIPQGTLSDSIDQLRNIGVEQVNQIARGFDVVDNDRHADTTIQSCHDENDPSIGRTVNTLVIAVSNIDEGALAMRELFSESETTTNDEPGIHDVEFGDGHVTQVDGAYDLFETVSGSYLVSLYENAEGGGVVSITNRTACGELR